MATYVLVHGAWGGAHGWRRLRPLLWARGHEVFTPALTGLGERSHLAGPEIDLSLHIKDVENLIFYEDLNDIVLVGHSYGGMVVTGVADRMPERIAHLVYLDAFLPAGGQSLSDLGGRGPPADASEWRVPPMARRYDTPEEEAWWTARRGPQPRRTFEEKVNLSLPLEKRAFSRTYIKATGDPRPAHGAPPSPFYRFADWVQNDPAWRYHELPTGHNVQVTMPAELTQLLLELVEGGPLSAHGVAPVKPSRATPG